VKMNFYQPCFSCVFAMCASWRNVFPISFRLAENMKGVKVLLLQLASMYCSQKWPEKRRFCFNRQELVQRYAFDKL